MALLWSALLDITPRKALPCKATLSLRHFIYAYTNPTVLEPDHLEDKYQKSLSAFLLPADSNLLQILAFLKCIVNTYMWSRKCFGAAEFLRENWALPLSAVSGASATSTLWPSRPNCYSSGSTSTRSSSWTGSVHTSVLWPHVIGHACSRRCAEWEFDTPLSHRRTFTMATVPNKLSTTTPTSFTCLFIAMTTATSSLEAERLMRWGCSADKFNMEWY